jgi:multidrug efflux system outer membrane protein
LVAFLKSQVLVQDLIRATNALSKASDLAMTQYQEGIADFNRVFVINRQLVLQLVALTRAQGEVPKSLILAFKAIGGGWKTPLEQTPVDGTLTAPLPPSPLGSKEPPQAAADEIVATFEVW